MPIHNPTHLTENAFGNQVLMHERLPSSVNPKDYFGFAVVFCEANAVCTPFKVDTIDETLHVAARLIMRREIGEWSNLGKIMVVGFGTTLDVIWCDQNIMRLMVGLDSLRGYCDDWLRTNGHHSELKLNI